MVELRPLPYLDDGLELAARMRRLPWFAWLDSGHPHCAGGRYDIFAAEPVATLVAAGGRARLEAAGATRWRDDPLAVLDELLRQRKVPPQDGLPFCGGALGYFGYEFGARRQGIEVADGDLPELALGLYDWAVVTDHLRRVTHWVGRPEALASYERVRGLLRQDPPADQAFEIMGEPRQQPGAEGYGAAFQRVRQYLLDGDCYQVNLARRFQADFRGDPWQAYVFMRRISPAPYGAYLAMPFGQILSLSPERFLEVEAGRVDTRPIKGTRPRRQDPQADRAERAALAASAKDRAENLMIVDLLRNDLGQVCETGSIRVDKLFEVQSFSTVHHLVSTVSGRLAPEHGRLDLLAACLPGGSITGAPKRRAMEIIRELESGPRGVYCGAIGYLSDHGRMDSSIAIRTAVCAGDVITYWAGGGLVVDSREASEFQETLDKAKAFLELVRASI